MIAGMLLAAAAPAFLGLLAATRAPAPALAGYPAAVLRLLLRGLPPPEQIHEVTPDREPDPPGRS